jgi:hypothetical protein
MRQRLVFLQLQTPLTAAAAHHSETEEGAVIGKMGEEYCTAAAFGILHSFQLSDRRVILDLVQFTQHGRSELLAGDYIYHGGDKQKDYFDAATNPRRLG